jgi:hypothetical protein
VERDGSNALRVSYKALSSDCISLLAACDVLAWVYLHPASLLVLLQPCSRFASYDLFMRTVPTCNVGNMNMTSQDNCMCATGSCQECLPVITTDPALGAESL